MIDRDFLRDYGLKELEEHNDFVRSILNGNYAYDRWPTPGRLELVEPYTFAIPLKKIWFQIPFYGTTIVCLAPISDRKWFEKVHGFDIDDIDRLINLAKKDRRVQFVLNKFPLAYAECDFIEPLLKELHPPVFGLFSLNPNLYSPEGKAFEVIEKDPDTREFVELAALTDFESMLKRIFQEQYNEKYTSMQIIYLGMIYSDLIWLGFDKLADTVALNMSLDQGKAYRLLLASKKLIVDRLSNTLKPVYSMNRQTVAFMSEELGSLSEGTIALKGIEFPFEVGRFLSSKSLNLIIPKNSDGAISLSDNYFEYRRLMQLLNRAVSEKKPDIALTKEIEIEETLENIWSDSIHLHRSKDIASFSIGMTVASIGFLATLPLGGLPGFLAGLGFAVLDKLMDKGIYSSLAEKMIKTRSPDPVICLYEFRKHKIK